jgi:UDP:flavonoid glycosyltransferase YjiC (YdhE family)
MRILVATTAGWGHFRPLRPFADAGLAAGHELVVAAPESFRGNVEPAGYRVSAFGDIPPEEFAVAVRGPGAVRRRGTGAGCRSSVRWRLGRPGRRCGRS